MRDLSALSIGAFSHIKDIQARGSLGRRLMDLGFTRGARVTCLFSAPGRGMRAYLIRGTVIALRKKDAKSILLEDLRHG